jgi:segregation and condensation protein B
MSIEIEKLTNIVEAALLAFGQPLSVDQLMSLFGEEEQVSRQDIREALQILQQSCEGRSVELVEVGSGFRYQARKDYAQWVSKLWEEKPPRYSRALLETLVLVAYRQPITRAEIEDIRGVSVSSHIMKTLQERDWVRIVGHKDVPGKPALYATTKAFLDYFNLKSLEELPSLMEIRDLDKISAEIDMQQGAEATQAAEEPQDLIEDEDIERLMPDGEADHGEGIESNVEESLETDVEGGAETPVAPVVTADSGQPLENSVAEAQDDESMQAETNEELIEEELEVLSEHSLDQSAEVLTTGSIDQEYDQEAVSEEIISQEELSGELVSEAENVPADMEEVGEQGEESITAAMAESTEEAALEQDELREAMQEPTQEIRDVQDMEDYGASDNSAENLNDAEETNPVEAEASDNEIEAEADNEQPFDEQMNETSEDLQEPRFSTANYGLRTGQQENAGLDDTAQDDNEIAEDERHPERFSAAESNS